VPPESDFLRVREKIFNMPVPDFLLGILPEWRGQEVTVMFHEDFSQHR
jgi:hypothetical protein